MRFKVSKKKVEEKARKIKILFLDVDGVLTDGGKYYLIDGSQIKRFHVQDGFGIEIWQKKGFKICIITDDRSGIMEKRASDLKIEMVFTGVKDKLSIFEKVIKENNIKKEECAYIGDDLPDIPVMEKAGLSIAVPNAVNAVKKIACCTTSKEGGNGAVREVIDFILSTKN